MIENLLGGGGGGGTVDTIQAGTGISVDSTNPASPIITNTSLNTDEVAKVSSNDTTAGYLNGKLVASSGISLTENNNGGNETLGIAVSNLDASAITTGTIATARLGSGTANSTTYLAGDQTYKTAVLSVASKTGAVTLAAADIASGVFATARLATSGTASSTTYLRGDQTWATISAGDTTYALTIQDAENTSTQRNLVSFTVPANTIADGEIVRIDIYYESYNMSGVQYNFTTNTVIGGSTLTSNVASIAGGTNGRYGIAHFFFIRQGSQLGTISSFSNDAYRAQEFANPTMFAGGSNVYDTRFFSYLSPNFTTSLTFAVTGQWSTGNPSAYVRVLNARAYKLAGQQT
jgi:hypothetical protein